MQDDREFPFAQMQRRRKRALLLHKDSALPFFAGIPERDGYMEVSYRLLFNTCSRIAKKLRAAGAARGSVAAIHPRNDVEGLLIAMALRMLDAVPALLAPDAAPQEAATRINSIHASFVIRTSPNADDALQIEITDFGKKTPVTDAALIIFTSGTGGTPKAVVHTQHTLGASLRAGASALRLTAQDTWLLCLPLHHIGGYSVALRTFFSGGALIFPEARKSSSIHTALQQHCITRVSMVTPQLLGLTEEHNPYYPHLKTLLLGGGPSTISLTGRALQLGLPVHKVYGSTETAAFISILFPKECKRKPDSSGRLLQGVEIITKGGELLVRAPQVMAGYYTAAGTFVRRQQRAWLRTGDTAKVEGGYLYVKNRRTDLIVSGGKNIDPLLIEEKLRAYPGIMDCCVFGIESEKWGMEVTAAVVLRPGTSAEHLEHYLRGELPGFMRPKRIFAVDELPRGELGKILRTAVRERVLTEAGYAKLL